jgi:hypothetical protein
MDRTSLSRRAAVGAALAMGSTLAAAQAAPADDARQVAEAVERLRAAMVDPDRATLEALVAEQLSYGHSSGKVDTKASFIRDLLDGTSNFESITLTDQSIGVLRDVATVRHTLTGATQDAGKPPGTVKLHVLTVWVRDGKDWKLLARQAVRPPAA